MTCKRCTHCNEEILGHIYVRLDEPDEYLCTECDDQLREELDDFTRV